MNTFKKKWNGVFVEDAGAVMSKQATSFCTAFKSMLKRNAEQNGYELVAFSKGHYYVSGFVKRGNSFVYFSYDIPRYGFNPICFEESNWRQQCLVRFAKDAKDFRGENNQYCKLADLPETLGKMLTKRENHRKDVAV